jgi:hypothetical protein
MCVCVDVHASIDVCVWTRGRGDEQMCIYIQGGSSVCGLREEEVRLGTMRAAGEKQVFVFLAGSGSSQSQRWSWSWTGEGGVEEARGRGGSRGRSRSRGIHKYNHRHGGAENNAGASPRSWGQGRDYYCPRDRVPGRSALADGREGEGRGDRTTCSTTTALRTGMDHPSWMG